MSEYTKDQEAEALSRVERNIYGTRDIDILYTMAKRTAEEEARADASEADAKRLADDWAAVLLERDALKARVAELEAAHQGLADAVKEERRKLVKLRCVCDEHGPCLEHEERWLKKAKELLTEQDDAPPPVVVTREAVEALSEFARTWARFGADCEPENAAARLVVALGEALEVKP